jgi:hypothetical protein
MLYAQSLAEAQERQQQYKETRLKKIAAQINHQEQGKNINGIVMRKCYAQGKTLIGQYEVPFDWYPLESDKSEMITTIKKAWGGFTAELFFQDDIDVEYQFYTGNKLRDKIHINSTEFANTQTDKDITIKGHPKSHGVDMNLKIPTYWKVEESKIEQVVMSFSYNMINKFGVEISDNSMFISRKEARELFEKESTANEFITRVLSTSYKNYNLLNHRIITINTYPALEFTSSGLLEQAGIEVPMKCRNWLILYEDKFILFSAISLDNGEFERMEPIYFQIINSIIFPEQYQR